MITILGFAFVGFETFDSVAAVIKDRYHQINGKTVWNKDILHIYTYFLFEMLYILSIFRVLSVLLSVLILLCVTRFHTIYFYFLINCCILLFIFFSIKVFFKFKN